MSKELAINGGPRAVTGKLKAWPNFDENAIKAVEEVLRSGKVNYWTGPKGMQFEKEFAAWQGSRFAISVATGTAALHVGLVAMGIGPGDEVIVPIYTFIASSFSIVQAGAIPRFADVNREDHCFSVESAEKLVNGRPGPSSLFIYTGMSAIWIKSMSLPKNTNCLSLKTMPKLTEVH